MGFFSFLCICSDYAFLPVVFAVYTVATCLRPTKVELAQKNSSQALKLTFTECTTDSLKFKLIFARGPHGTVMLSLVILLF